MEVKFYAWIVWLLCLDDDKKSVEIQGEQSQDTLLDDVVKGHTALRTTVDLPVEKTVNFLNKYIYIFI